MEVHSFIERLAKSKFAFEGFYSTSSWFQNCCMESARGLIAILTLPAMLVAFPLAGGSVHGGGEWNFYVGMAVQFYLLFWLARWIVLRRRHSQ